MLPRRHALGERLRVSLGSSAPIAERVLDLTALAEALARCALEWVRARSPGNERAADRHDGAETRKVPEKQTPEPR
jgi:hypothetical protein